MKKILLSRGMEAMIDDEDFDKVSSYKWSYATVGYAIRRFEKKIIYLHRFIMNAPDDRQVDHRDNNRLNNQKDNLRLCEQHQNTKSQLKRTDRIYTSKHKGVHFDKRRNKWKAEITINYKNKYLGRFETETESVSAYNRYAIKYFGEFSKLNVL